MLDTEAYNYPWTKDQEPPDVYRNIEDIQVIQIEQYCQFMSGMINQKMDIAVVIILLIILRYEIYNINLYGVNLSNKCLFE